MNAQLLHRLSARFKFAAALVFLCALLLVPAPASAQSNLPVNWVYSPMQPANAVAYSPDGSLVAIGGVSSIQIYKVATGALMRCLPTAAYTVNSVAFSPDGKTLADGGYWWNGTYNFPSYRPVVELWTVSTGAMIGSLNSTAQGISSIAFSPDGTMLADGGSMIEIWNLATQKLLTSLTPTAPVYSLAYSPTGSILADCGVSGDTDGFIEQWSTSTWKSNGVVTTQFWPEAVAFSPDGKTIADTGTEPDNYVGVVETRSSTTGSILKSFPTSATYANAVEFSRDGNTLAVGGSNYNRNTQQSTGVLELWNIAFTKVTRLGTACNGVGALAYSPDGKTICDVGAGFEEPLYGPNEGVVEIWTLATGELLTSPKPSAYDLLGQLAFSPDGNTLASGGVSSTSSTVAYGAIDLWSVATGSLLAQMDAGENQIIACVAFSPVGNFLAAGGGTYAIAQSSAGKLAIWNPATAKLIQGLATNLLFVHSVSFSPDGKTLAAAGEKHESAPIELWNVATGTMAEPLATSAYYVFSTSYSPDGSLLGLGGFDDGVNPIVELWNPATGKLSRTINTSVAYVNSVSFSPDGKTFAVAGSNSAGPVVELWSVASGKLTTTLSFAAATNNAYSVSFTPDGSNLFVGTDNGIQAFGTTTFKLTGLYNEGLLANLQVAGLAVSPTNAAIAYGTSRSGLYLSPNPFHSGSATVSSLTLNPSTVAGGSASTGTLTLTAAASKGGVSIPLSSTSDSVSIPDSVTVPGGSTSATFTVSTIPVPSQANVTITAGSAGAPKTAMLTILPVSVSSLTVSPNTVLGGTNSNGALTISAAAGPGGITVSLASSSPAIEIYSNGTIPYGSKSITFLMPTTPVNSQTTAVITASLPASSKAATLTITPPTLAFVALNPASIVGGTSTTGVVQLSGSAASNGFVVSLSSSSTLAAVPASVTIAAGSISQNFLVTTSAVAATQVITFMAKSGTVSAKALLRLTPPPLTSVTVSPTAVVGGATSAGTVTIGTPATTGGVVVSLASNNAAASVPPSVTIAAATTSATFTVKTSPVATQTTATITATLGTSFLTATLTVNTVALSTLTLSPTTVVGGSTSTGTVTLTGMAPSGGSQVSLSSNASSATVPASITVASGKTSNTFTVNTVAVAANVSATITATLGTMSKAAPLTVSAPTLSSVTLNPVSVVGGQTSVATVTIGSAAPTSGLSVILTSSSKDATIPPILVIQAGQTSGRASISTGTVSAQTTATITATLGSASKTAMLTITG